MPTEQAGKDRIMKVPWACVAVGGLVLMFVTLGCRAERETAKVRAKATTDAPARIAETATVTIPDAPVSGSASGKEFQPSDQDKPYVTGKIDFPIVGDGTLLAGYCGITVTGNLQSSARGVPVFPHIDSARLEDTASGPAFTWLDFVQRQGARYRHTHLKPGTYLFYAKWKETCLSGRWLTIDDASGITLDLTLNPQESGALEVRVASEAGQEPIELLPLDDQAGLPARIDPAQVQSLKRSVGLTAQIVASRARFETLGPGAYRVFYHQQSRDTIIKRGETADVKFP